MEKLWTTSEAAKFLGLQDADIERLVKDGKLTGYKLAGQFLRFKPDQIKALKASGAMRIAAPAPAAAGAAGPAGGWQDRFGDLWYFYDFYLLSFVLLAALVIYLVSSG